MAKSSSGQTKNVLKLKVKTIDRIEIKIKYEGSIDNYLFQYYDSTKWDVILIQNDEIDVIATFYGFNTQNARSQRHETLLMAISFLQGWYSDFEMSDALFEQLRKSEHYKDFGEV